MYLQLSLRAPRSVPGQRHPTFHLSGCRGFSPEDDGGLSAQQPAGGALQPHRGVPRSHRPAPAPAPAPSCPLTPRPGRLPPRSPPPARSRGSAADAANMAAGRVPATSRGRERRAGRRRGRAELRRSPAPAVPGPAGLALPAAGQQAGEAGSQPAPAVLRLTVLRVG